MISGKAWPIEAMVYRTVAGTAKRLVLHLGFAKTLTTGYPCMGRQLTFEDILGFMSCGTPWCFPTGQPS